ncbi:MAG TPA: hypothetical protein VMI73_04605 [Trebonia sp.]|nr:hypothetical protein [Trebonia sp.]
MKSSKRSAAAFAALVTATAGVLAGGVGLNDFSANNNLQLLF